MSPVKTKQLPKVQDCIKAGKFFRTHGINGKLIIKDFSSVLFNNPQQFIFVELDNILIPFSVVPDSISIRNHYSIFIKLEEITNEEEAQLLIESNIYILDIQQKNKEKNTPPYISENPDKELIGFTVHEKRIGKIGKIVSVENYAGNINFVIRYKESLILYPKIPENILDINPEKKTITVSSSPQGIFDL